MTMIVSSQFSIKLQPTHSIYTHEPFYIYIRNARAYSSVFFGVFLCWHDILFLIEKYYNLIFLSSFYLKKKKCHINIKKLQKNTRNSSKIYHIYIYIYIYIYTCTFLLYFVFDLQFTTLTQWMRKMHTSEW